MNKTEAPPLLVLPTANEFAAMARNRTYLFTLLGCLVSLACAVTYMLLPSLIVPALLVLLLLAGVLLWHYPRLAFYTVLAAVCLFEVNSVLYPDSITERIPFFVNVNTLIQVFAHVNFKAIPFSPLEILLFVGGSFSFIRGVFLKNLKLRAGPVFLPIFVYCCFVFMGWINGMLTGGDFKISLMEVRPQFHLLLAYLMGTNILRNRCDIDKVFWIIAISIGIKGILYTFRRYVTLAGQPMPDGGVGSHEEAFLFAAYIALLFVISFFPLQKRLLVFMWTLLPFVVLGELATNRRAGIGAIALSIPLLFLAIDRAIPAFRTRIRVLSAVLLISFLIYYSLFKSREGAFAQPAHAISSMFNPDARDASSNAYRDAENADLMATIKLAPLQGYGYGKRMVHAVPIADISTQYEFWDIMTHNSVLWIWMRLGTLGFFAFWIMIANLLLYACRVLRSKPSNPIVVPLAVYLLLLVSMLLVFGLLDLGLTNFREMIFVGICAGALAAAEEFPLRSSPVSEKSP